MKKKSAILLIVMALLVGSAVGGTIAWITVTTNPVENTFTAGDIDITLTESEDLDLKMIPGRSIAKDPKITVLAGSEACWLFVKIEEANDAANFITYNVASGWTALSSVDGVYYREVAATTADTGFYVLEGNTDHPNGIVTVPDTVTKDALEVLTETTNPKLTFTAYACQKEGVNSASEAWAKF